MKKLSIALAAIAISAALVLPSQAWAASLPYIDDVNDWGAGKSIATVVVSGDKPQLKVTSGGKKVKVTKHKKGVWTVVLKNGKKYKLSSREKGGKWKSIGYRVY